MMTLKQIEALRQKWAPRDYQDSCKQIRQWYSELHQDLANLLAEEERKLTHGKVRRIKE